jgi:hypothetical protein
MSTAAVVIKVFFGNDTHRLVFSNGVKFDDLVGKIGSRLSKDKSALVLKYEDQEQDRITLTCDEDVHDALKVAQEMKSTSLKVYVSLKNDASDKDDAFVLLHNNVEENKEVSPIPNKPVSFEDLNNDFQRMLGEKLKVAAAAQEVKIEESPRSPLVVESVPAPVFEEARSPVVEEKSEVDSSSLVHAGVSCDGCKKSPIVGVRFKCIECFNFDLCAACEASGAHPADHPMLKIKLPRDKETEQMFAAGRRGCRKGMGLGRCSRSFAKFVEDVSIPDRSDCAPGESRNKIWRLQNVGPNDWPAGIKAVCISGEEVVDASSREIVLPAIKAGETFEVSAKINVPKVSGRYVANFKLVNHAGEKFGPKVWVDFYVPEIAVKPKKVEEQKAVEVPAPVAPPKSAAEIKYQEQLEVLASLGFEDTSLNIYLLDKFEGKSERVVHWLLDRARSN